MGFFNKLFKSEEKSTQVNNEPAKENPNSLDNKWQSSVQAARSLDFDDSPAKSETELLEHFGALAYEKQLALTDLIGSKSWNVDMKKGEISFGGDMVYQMQALGSFSHGSESWLWGWANAQSGLSESILIQANAMKQFGEENDIELFKESSTGCSKEYLHLIGMIGSGMFNSDGYYIADYGQGAMLLTMTHPQLKELTNNKYEKILTSFPQFISEYSRLSHYMAFIYYVNKKGFNVSEKGDIVMAENASVKIFAEFDQYGRFLSLEATM